VHTTLPEDATRGISRYLCSYGLDARSRNLARINRGRREARRLRFSFDEVAEYESCRLSHEEINLLNAAELRRGTLKSELWKDLIEASLYCAA